MPPNVLARIRMSEPESSHEELFSSSKYINRETSKACIYQDLQLSSSHSKLPSEKYKSQPFIFWGILNWPERYTDWQQNAAFHASEGSWIPSVG